jgi:hypothetical protein
MADNGVRFVVTGGYEWRVTENVNGPTPHLDVRTVLHPPSVEQWSPWVEPKIRMLAAHAADMQARANEFADLNNEQARRIAELEALRDSLVGIALQVAALPTIHEGGPDEASDVDDVIRHARETLEEFVLVPTGSL